MELSTERFKVRSFVSMLTAFAFVLMAISGIVIFFTPSGRIARDTSWAFFGLGMSQWIAVHLWMSLVFLITSGIHIYYNYKPILSYFHKKTAKAVEIRIEWIAALLLCLFISLGAAKNIAPFSPLMTLRGQYKPCGQAGGCGQGGYAIAANAAAAGAVCPDCGQTHAPAAVQPAQTQGHASVRGGGFGQITLSQFCIDSGISVNAALGTLSNQGVSAQANMTMRDIAAANGLHPSAIRGLLGGF